jgi:hypothetical protein
MCDVQLLAACICAVMLGEQSYGFCCWCLSRMPSSSALLCRFWDGIYVLYTYAAQRKTSQAVQKLLSTPVVGKEKNVLRHMTFITN